MIPPLPMPNKENIVSIFFVRRCRKCTDCWNGCATKSWILQLMSWKWNDAHICDCVLCGHGGSLGECTFCEWMPSTQIFLLFRVFSVECRILFGCKRMNEMIFNSIRLFLRLQPFCSSNIPKRWFYWLVKRLLRYKFCIDPTKLGSTDWMS